MNRYQQQNNKYINYIKVPIHHQNSQLDKKNGKPFDIQRLSLHPKIYIKNIYNAPKSFFSIENHGTNHYKIYNQNNRSSNKKQRKFFLKNKRNQIQISFNNAKKKNLILKCHPQKSKEVINLHSLQKYYKKNRQSSNTCSRKHNLNCQQNLNNNNNVIYMYKNDNNRIKTISYQKNIIRNNKKSRNIDKSFETIADPKIKGNSIFASQNLQVLETNQNQIEDLDIFYQDIEINWDKQKFPKSSKQCLQNYSKYLTAYQKIQIKKFKFIYYIGPQAFKINGNIDGQITTYDDQHDHYKFVLNDHIGYRYQILEILGKGAFGQVLKVFDHKKKQYSSLKIIKNNKKLYNQGLVQIKILKFIKENDVTNQTNILKIKDFIYFRNHICIICELLDISLQEFLEKNRFQGLSLDLIRKFGIQILQSLMFLHYFKIIHCDLKPENIVFKQQNKSGIKLIDFGSGCFQNQKIYTYIQSRFYRAPEIILGTSYGTPIDIWSFGCILAQLYMGYPLFPGQSQNEQMLMFMQIIGIPQQQFIKVRQFYQQCVRKKHFFDEQNKPILIPNSKGKIYIPNSKIINDYLDSENNEFVDFITRCLCWYPQKRITAKQALLHKWILQGLPQQIRIQHIQQMNDKNPYKLLPENQQNN